MTPEYELLYIGGKNIPNFIMKPENCEELSPHIIKHDIANIRTMDTYECDRTTHSYIITNRMATILLNCFILNAPIKIPLDHWILRVVVAHNIDIYNSKPLLCHSPFDGDSDIEPTRKNNDE